METIGRSNTTHEQMREYVAGLVALMQEKLSFTSLSVEQFYYVMRCFIDFQEYNELEKNRVALFHVMKHMRESEHDDPHAMLKHVEEVCGVSEEKQKAILEEDIIDTLSRAQIEDSVRAALEKFNELHPERMTLLELHYFMHYMAEPFGLNKEKELAAIRLLHYEYRPQM